MAILNSYILEIYIKYRFQTLAREYRFKTFLVNELPILNPENIEKETLNKIIDKSQKLFDNYNKALEDELNLLIKEIYQIDDDEYSYIRYDLYGLKE